MELSPNNTDAFIIRCIQNAKRKLTEKEDDSSIITSSTEPNSILLDYLKNDDEFNFDYSSISSRENDTLSTSSLCSDTYSLSDSREDDETYTESSIKSTKSITSTCTSMNGDMLPKSFLQLTGIAVGNFNMGCNFHISAAIRIMAQYNLTILAIQEHTPWNKDLSDGEIMSIKRHCDKWGYFVTISKLQILIIDKQIAACHEETVVLEEGRILESRFQISTDNYVTFVFLTPVERRYNPLM
jgi:hypothetical protein